MEQILVNGLTQEEMMERLQEPFDPKHIEWRVQRTLHTRNGWKAVVLAYVTNRAIMDRLDNVFGLANWQNEYVHWGDKGVLCRLKVKFGNEWICKEDGAETTAVESVKGGFSASMKRAAVQLGIGRYLYNLEEVWVDLKEKGENFVKVQENGQNKYLYWDTPKLPTWALPKVTSQQQNQNQHQQHVGKDAEVEAKKLVLQEIVKLEKILGLKANQGQILPLFRRANGNDVGEAFKLPNDIASHATLEQLNNYHRVIKPIGNLVAFARNNYIEQERFLEFASVVLKEKIKSISGLFFKADESNVHEILVMMRQEIRNRQQQVS